MTWLLVLSPCATDAVEADRAIQPPSRSFEEGHRLRLATRLTQSNPGDWALLQVQDQAVLWRIDHDGDARILAEWAVPTDLLDAWGTHTERWQQWAEQDGPGAQARSVYRWMLQTGWDIWDPALASWQPLGQEGTLLRSLFELPLCSVPPCHQRRCGPRPKPGMPDERPIWRPVAARSMRHMEVWTGSLQTDAECESAARVTLWLAPESEDRFPAFFPLHAEVERLGVRFSCRLLAAGRMAPLRDLSTMNPPGQSSL